MSQIVSALAGGYVLLASTLAVLATIAWRRSRSTRQALLATGFFLAAIGGVVTTTLLFRSDDAYPPLLVLLASSSASLAVIYLAAVKR